MLSNHTLQEAQNLRYQNSWSFYEGSVCVCVCVRVYIYMDFVLLMVLI